MYIIIADDLTGATDTGIQFEKRGIPTTVLVDPPERPLYRQASDTALSVNASTRAWVAGCHAAYPKCL